MWTNGSRSDRSTPAERSPDREPLALETARGGAHASDTAEPRVRGHGRDAVQGGRVVDGDGGHVPVSNLRGAPAIPPAEHGAATAASFGADDTLLPDHHREGILLDLDLEARLSRQREHDALDDRRALRSRTRLQLLAIW